MGTLQEACSMNAFLGRKMAPRLRVLLGTMKDIAAGVAHIHSRGLVHGDLTANNVSRTNHAKSGPCPDGWMDTLLLVSLGASRQHRQGARLPPRLQGKPRPQRPPSASVTNPLPFPPRRARRPSLPTLGSAAWSSVTRRSTPAPLGPSRTCRPRCSSQGRSVPRSTCIHSGC